ncbi:MAG: hypothetical protein GEU79_18840 [Acidimicrobiia bacterium]|nr:hypothetical protein [Acidimicrobiia bacterium]
MADMPSPRAFFANLIGLVIVGLLGWWVLRSVLGSVFWLVRTAVLLVILAGLVWLFLAVRGSSDS